MINHSTAGCFMTHVEMTSQMMSFEFKKKPNKETDLNQKEEYLLFLDRDRNV